MDKSPTRQAPARLNETVYEPKRQRTFEVVKRAVDTLMQQRELDGMTRISLNTIMAMAKQQDPEGRGIAHTAILENEQAYAYYKRHRTASMPAKRQPRTSSLNTRPVIKADRDQTRVKQRYMKLSREELADHLLLLGVGFWKREKREAKKGRKSKKTSLSATIRGTE